MKLVQNFVFAVLLAFVLAVSAPAGEVEGPGAKPTPPPAPASAPDPICATSDEETCDPNANIVTAETSDYLFFEALAALLSVY